MHRSAWLSATAKEILMSNHNQGEIQHEAEQVQVEHAPANPKLNFLELAGCGLTTSMKALDLGGPAREIERMLGLNCTIVPEAGGSDKDPGKSPLGGGIIDNIKK
jgi:hypothetical protein